MHVRGLVPVKAFDGLVTTCRDKVLIDHGDSARGDPLGFYHGMRVTHGNTEFVLGGPAISIVAGDEEPAQGDLFPNLSFCPSGAGYG